ncbi:MAG: hypothetical protein Q4C01_07350 [Clostridia bacterium]|nr:hypothetical protein [Clostridia bacterium]
MTGDNRGIGAEKEKKRSTSALWARLFKAPSARSYLDANREDLGLPSFSAHINLLCQKRVEVPERVIKRAGIERSFGHQLFRGSRNLSRDTVLMLAFGFEADVDMAQSLLLHAGCSRLYPRIQRDSAISYALDRKYTLMETQHLLAELELPLIGGDVR